MPATVTRSAWKVPALGVALLTFVLAACGGGDGKSPVDNTPTVASVSAAGGDGQSAVVAQALADSLRVRVADGTGKAMSGVSVSWSVESGGGSVTPTSLTDLNGVARARWTLGTTAGAGSVRASAGSLSATFSATATAAATNTVTVTPATLTLSAGATGQYQAAAVDAYGNAITGRAIAWSTSDASVATVSATGLATAVGGGTAQIRATIEGKTGSAPLTVTGAVNAPTIATITPTTLTPGATATITGTNFSSTPGATTVTVNGVNANVTAATGTELSFTVPAVSALGCLPTGSVEVAVKVGSATGKRSHPLRTGTGRTLAVGEVFVSTASNPFGCTELAASSGKYLMAVYNIAGAPAAGSFVATGPSIRLSSALGASGNVVEATSSSAAVTSDVPASPQAESPMRERMRRFARGHEEVLAVNEQMLRQRPALNRTGGLAGQAALVQQAAAVGDTIWIRYPDVSKPSSQICAQYDSLRARVVFVGTRNIVLEDIAAPLATRVDSLLTSMGQAFDTSQYPIINNNFGDPLVLDAQLNNDGKLYMLFTRKVNTSGNGNLLGFVWSGDFFPRTGSGFTCPQSNMAEIFYGLVPTLMTGSGGNEDYNIAEWKWLSRSTVIHEVRHVASMAARIKSGARNEERWLEEAGAQAAEELWARELFGYAQNGNTGFNASILREVNDWQTMPLIMYNHFSFLYDYFATPDSLSFLGSIDSGENTLYGSAWAFLRWVTDQSGMSEATFLKGLTQASTAGIASITALTGKTYETLMGEFALANALDDRAGFTITNPRLTYPSWNLRNIYAGLNQSTSFPLPYPLVPRSVTSGPYDVSQIRPGGAAYFEFTVPSTGSQALQVIGGFGTPLSADLRIALVRLQ